MFTDLAGTSCEILKSDGGNASPILGIRQGCRRKFYSRNLSLSHNYRNPYTMKGNDWLEDITFTHLFLKCSAL